MSEGQTKEPHEGDRERNEAAEDASRPISLSQLSGAFQEMLGPSERPTAEANGDSPDEGSPPQDVAPEEDAPTAESEEVTPGSILEAMLFVGNPSGEPLTSRQVAQLIRGVEPNEVDDLVRKLNQNYRAEGTPYWIDSVGAGYKLKLRDEFKSIREKFYGRVRQARLSQAAVEVLALVAYNQPISSDQISSLRGHPSGAIVSQLVRRRLLKMQRPADMPRRPVYHTTPRFLRLFGLSSITELPQAMEVEKH